MSNETQSDPCMPNVQSIPEDTPIDRGRSKLEQLIEQNGHTLAHVSRYLNKNDSYIHQFLYRFTPRRLSEYDRMKLAEFFGVEEYELGGPKRAIHSAGNTSALAIAPLAIDPSSTSDHRFFDSKLIDDVAVVDYKALRYVHIDDDSMYPTFVPGALAIVDTNSTELQSVGIFALRQNSHIFVRRVTMNPGTKRASLFCENSKYESWKDIDISTLDVVGRVILVSQRT